ILNNEFSIYCGDLKSEVNHQAANKFRAISSVADSARALAYRDLRYTQSNGRTGQLGCRNNAAEVFENVCRNAKTLPLPASQIRFLPILMPCASSRMWSSFW